jgi:transposase
MVLESFPVLPCSSRENSRALKTTLVQAAWAAARKKNSQRRAQFLGMKAIRAVAASMLTAAYHMLLTGAVYKDLGEHSATAAIA